MSGPLVFNVAQSTPFDNSTNGFDGYNVQLALEEIDYRQATGEPSGFVERTDSVIGFDDATLTFSITPVGDSFDVYVYGHKTTVTSPDTATITDTEGMWFFVYEAGGVLTASQTRWLISAGAICVSYVYWDATNKKAIYLGDERHGLVMDHATHSYHHNLDGARILKPYKNFLLGDYILRGDGSLDSHAQISIGDGDFYDEDIVHSVTDTATPSGPFEQTLSTIAQIPIYYRDGSDAWRKLDATSFPVAYDGVNTIKYNYYDDIGDAWSLVNATEGYFVTMWLFVNNNSNEPVALIAGRQYATVSEAASEPAFLLTQADEIMFPESVALYRLIFYTSTAYTNTPKAVLYAFSKISEETKIPNRYTFTAQYKGKARSGKVLEFFPGIASNEAPFVFPETSFIRTITLNTSSTDTGVVSFYRITDPSTPVLSITHNATTYTKQEYSLFFSADDQIFAMVDSGSLRKPALRIWIQTDIT